MGDLSNLINNSLFNIILDEDKLISDDKKLYIYSSKKEEVWLNETFKNITSITNLSDVPKGVVLTIFCEISDNFRNQDIYSYIQNFLKSSGVINLGIMVSVKCEKIREFYYCRVDQEKCRNLLGIVFFKKGYSFKKILDVVECSKNIENLVFLIDMTKITMNKTLKQELFEYLSED